MTSPSTVRIGVGGDFNAVCRLLEQAHPENHLFPYNENKCKWFISRALSPHLIPVSDTRVRGVIGVIGPVGKCEAMAFLMIGEFWYSDHKHIEEFVVYVDQDHRASNHARALIGWMKSQVEATGLPLLTGILSAHRNAAKCGLYRKFLPKAGEFFFLAPKGSSYPEFSIVPPGGHGGFSGTARSSL